MSNLKETKAFKGSMEDRRLKKLTDFDVTNLTKIVTSQIRDMQKKALNPNEDFQLAQCRGYEFEWEMWQFFNELQPDLMCNPDFEEPFRFDLQEYREAVKAKGDDWGLISKQSTKQMDVVGIYGKHAFVIECKHTETEQNSEKLGSAIEELKIRSHFITKRLQDLFDGIIPVYILCTSNFNLENRDQIESALDQGIIILSEKEREYISTVLKGEKDKKTLKYKGGSGSPEFTLLQFLGYFRNNKPDYNHKGGTKWRIPAFHSLSGPNKKDKVYTFSISPNEMLKVSTVAHQKLKSAYEVTQTSNRYYQRVLSRERLLALGEHLNKTKQPYPNNILVSYRGEELTFIPTSTEEEIKTNTGNIPGIIEFDACPGTFHVIDGQHRLFGYTQLPKDQGIRNDHRIIVTAFEGLNVGEEADIFLEVNSKAQPIKPDLLMEIEWAARVDNGRNIKNGIVMLLRDEENSCLHENILQAESRQRGKLNPTNLRNNLDLIMFPSSIKLKTKHRETPFWDTDVIKTAFSAYEFFNNVLSEFKKHNQDRWKKSKGVLQDIFMAGLFKVIERAFVTFDGDIEKIKEVMDVLGKNFSKTDNKKKDDMLTMKFYGTQGKEAPKKVAAYLVDQYLKDEPSYSELVRDGDEEDLLSVGRGDLIKELIAMEQHIQRLETQILLFEQNGSAKIKDKSENSRAVVYCSLMKNIVEVVLSKDEHYTNEFWKWLIRPAFWNEDNVWDKIEARHRNEQKESGAYAYNSTFNHVEGNPLRQLLFDFKAYDKAKPPETETDFTPEQRKNNVLNYIWTKLLIPAPNTNKSQKIDLNPPVWKAGVEYLAIFEKLRNYGTKSLASPHAKLINETGDPSKKERELFNDYYEPQFKNLLKVIAEDLSAAKALYGEIDIILND